MPTNPAALKAPGQPSAAPDTPANAAAPKATADNRIVAPVAHNPVGTAAATAAPESTTPPPAAIPAPGRRHAGEADDVTSAPTDVPLTQVNVAAIEAAAAAAIPNPAAPVASVPNTGTETRPVQWGSDNITDVIRHVTRTLALRDLEALQAGREVVLRLDAAVLPDTALHFRTDGSEAVVRFQTGSNDVQQFLDGHLDQLLSAMAAEVPGLRWNMAPEMSAAAIVPLAIAPASDASDSSPAGNGQTGRESGGNAGGGSGGQSGNQPDQQRDAQNGRNPMQSETPNAESTVAFFEAEVATAPR